MNSKNWLAANGWRSFHTMECGCELWSYGATVSRHEPDWALKLICKRDRARKEKCDRDTLQTLDRQQMQQLRRGVLGVAEALEGKVIPMLLSWPLARLGRALETYHSNPSSGTKSWVTKKRKVFEQAVTTAQMLLDEGAQIKSGARKMTADERTSWEKNFYQQTWIAPGYAERILIPTVTGL